jgi:hypothetical protein
MLIFNKILELKIEPIPKKGMGFVVLRGKYYEHEPRASDIILMEEYFGAIKS